MTNRKTIERLKAVRNYLCAGNPIWDVNEMRDVFELAISALQAQDDGDCISRQAALDAVFNNAEHPDKAYEAIRHLPSAQHVPQWIPVSERLPEELETVIITWKNHKPESYYSDIKDKPLTGVGIYHREKWWWWSAYAEDMLVEYGDSKADRMDEAIEVTAWMPLPKPYRAERRTDGDGRD